ncbi:DUF3718 domain-containing protein [Pseudoalteromonas luteoviolacea]|uniref:DUF3718 domain-containing protein n=1 Tax=Pseudoalteromonas luteoviolacea DSM 6061 TaxID=1365250 RepID=A0A161XY10_9GAMM|nr:DUF3718 domain-containing protein [Pseudoalteromonas luteoviolacea]KZN39708.1 hypothetical protein N475_13190 [Pseudoalteromonas luteoviolacea DSM 6061]KZN55320.1 hypothetical protein N474_15145 [Pseudoalteromonas luteoviolacea CPMOR-2]MBE0385638.1 hypothetical protein [Pseudoalteromonas luteoviolacea DSM 6061]TQF70635.1 DUF3718 domain-containing protein [Pseudoalteromonas luteoviolacea]
MKALLTAVALVGLASTAHQTQAVEFVAADDSIATNLCMAFASNRPHIMLEELRGKQSLKKNIANKLHCNDMDLEEFAETYSLTRNAKFMNIELDTKTSIKDLTTQKAPATVVLSGSK